MTPARSASAMTTTSSPITCGTCRGSGEQYYQARDSEYVLAARPACGNGRVGSKGSGVLRPGRHSPGAGPQPGHPVKDGAGYDGGCGECLAGPGEWACQRCGLAFFGTPPEYGLCRTCRTQDGAA